MFLQFTRVLKVSDLTLFCRPLAVIWIVMSIKYGDGIMTFCGYDSALKKRTHLT